MATSIHSSFPSDAGAGLPAASATSHTINVTRPLLSPNIVLRAGGLQYIVPLTEDQQTRLNELFKTHSIRHLQLDTAVGVLADGTSEDLDSSSVCVEAFRKFAREVLDGPKKVRTVWRRFSKDARAEDDAPASFDTKQEPRLLTLRQGLTDREKTKLYNMCPDSGTRRDKIESIRQKTSQMKERLAGVLRALPAKDAHNQKREKLKHALKKLDEIDWFALEIAVASSDRPFQERVDLALDFIQRREIPKGLILRKKVSPEAELEYAREIALAAVVGRKNYYAHIKQLHMAPKATSPEVFFAQQISDWGKDWNLSTFREKLPGLLRAAFGDLAETALREDLP